MFQCVNNLFQSYDYNNLPINCNVVKKHNTPDNAWIVIGKEVFSIRKDDTLLLNIFKNYYGKDVKEFILKNEIFKNIKIKISILEKLKERKIGSLSQAPSACSKSSGSASGTSPTGSR